MNRLHGVPQLRQLPFLGPQSQQLMAAYLASLSARHYSPKILQATVGIIKSFCVRLPVACQARLYPDLTQATPEDIDAWLDAAHHDSLAPSTLNNILNGLHRFFAFLQEQGYLARSPINCRQHRVIMPHTLPSPMAEDDVVRFFKVVAVLRDRLMFLLMLRCGLRVGEVSTLTWPLSISMPGPSALTTAKGRWIGSSIIPRMSSTRWACGAAHPAPGGEHGAERTASGGGHRGRIARGGHGRRPAAGTGISQSVLPGNTAWKRINSPGITPERIVPEGVVPIRIGAWVGVEEARMIDGRGHAHSNARLDAIERTGGGHHHDQQDNKGEQASPRHKPSHPRSPVSSTTPDRSVTAHAESAAVHQNVPMG